MSAFSTQQDLFGVGDEDSAKIKSYKQILPMRTDITIESQFGWIPVSIFKPERAEYWRKIIGDDGDQTSRRSDDAKYLPGLRFSEFHPHLAEICIRYWSMEGAVVIDPFAGRATRGMVALSLGRQYEGYEIAPTTAKATHEKVTAKGGVLYQGDGTVLSRSGPETADLVFTCPPYHQLERYESTPGQLSDVRKYEDFLQKIRLCASNIARVLKRGGFCCWVCADWRDGEGMRLFHCDSIKAFVDGGLSVHDIVIVHNNSPFTHLQAGKVAANRYTSKTHEYVLVLRKEL